MVSKKETARIRKFVCDELRGEEDLSTLTLGTLKKRYLALVGEDSLSPDARTYMKQVVAEELMKLEENDEDEGEVESEKPQNKRKREEEHEGDDSGSEAEDESASKKPRRQSSSSSSSESEDNEGHKSGSEDEEEEEVKSESKDSEDSVEKPHGETNGVNREGSEKSEDSSDEDKSEESESEIPKEEGVKKEEEDEGEGVEKTNKDESSDDSENEEKVPVKTGNDSDSDSSSLPSLEDEPETKKNNKKDDKKKNSDSDDSEEEDKKKNKKGERQKDADKQVVRLKRYISLCGATRNYKKLLEGCRSVRAMVTALKKELEDLGVEGRPTIQKCKRVKRKREEAREVAELDINNIITTQGRPKRRAASARHDIADPASPSYKRALNSGSDSDEENKRPRRRTDWSNLQGIISDGADSD